ncbi:MAG: VWA domain-containing protein [Erysipelotrichaceae bacterium]|nr:VWA domain-containing protein [Erysipelotrichaceae bacterium]
MKIKNIIKMGLVLFLALGIISLPNNVDALTQEELDTIHMDKTATYNGDGTYTINLETYVTGDITVTSEDVPVDFILVLDQSGSMDSYFASGKTRMEALKDAAHDFVDSIDALDRTTGDTVSIVGFATDPDTVYATPGGGSYQVTEAFDGNTGPSPSTYQDTPGWPYNTVMGWSYTNLVSRVVKGVETNNSDIHDAIDSLKPEGATSADTGMEIARQIYNATASNGHLKVILFFTDGVPTTASSFSPTVANAAITVAKELKDNGVKIFTVKTSNVNDSNTINYMKAMSSNYPYATSYISLGTQESNDFYYNVADTLDMQNVFETVQNYGIVQNSILSTDTELVDYCSDVLTVPALADVHVYTYAYTGSGTFSSTGVELTKGVDVTATIDSVAKTITVTGFDYAANSCIDGDGTIPTQGNKLVVSFTTTDIPGFIGGNNVETNTPDSALYYEDEEIKPFPEPTVNVPLDYEFTANDQAIYITNNLEDVTAFFDNVSTSGIQYQIDGVTYDLGEHRNDYADVTYQIYDGTTLIGEYTIPAGGTTGSFTWYPDELDTSGLTGTHEYTIKAVVETQTALPTSTGTPVTAPLVIEDTAKVFVFVPQVTTNDEVIFKGESFTVDNINETVNWVCNDPAYVPGVDPAVQGTAPTLSYSLDGGTSSVITTPTTKDTNVITYNVSVYANGNDVTANLATGSDVQFNVYIVEGEFQITQIIDVEYSQIDISALQGFGYEIQKLDGGGNVVETYNVALYPHEGSSDSDIISGLSIGTYRVVSDDAWLVRYTNALQNPDSDPISPDSIIVTLSRDDLNFVDIRQDDIVNLAAIGITITNTDDDVTFVATKVPSYWLSDSGYSRNIINNPVSE